VKSIVERAEQMTGTQLTKMRWAVGLNGLLSVAFGVVILIWPGISLYALTILFGAYALASGVVGLVSAFSSSAKGERGWLIFSSLLGIGVGVMVLAWTDISALALLYVIGAYAIAFGIIAVVGAFWLPIDGSDTVLMIILGLISVLFGIVIFARPGTGALVLLDVIAAFALIIGVTQVTLAIGGERLVNRELKEAFAPANRQPSHQVPHRGCAHPPRP
jgi:uncharacterized membrane protein HdeD (DUF308 family)